MFKYSPIISALIISTPLFLSGCSSDGGGSSSLNYTGSTTAAVIDADNAETISTTATEAATQAISESIADESNPFPLAVDSSNLPSNEINTTVAAIINKLQNQPGNLVTAVTVGADYFTQDPYYCGGSITVPDNENATSGKITFNNFCYSIDGPVTLNGSITFSSTATTLTITYKNFTATFEGESFTINTSMSCNLDAYGYITTCTISSLYKGTDGLTYRIDDFSVTGDPTFGFDVDATFYNPTYGSVVITTTSPIMLECTGTQPSSGAISFAGSGGTSGSISFDSCTSYTYCYDLGSGPTCNSGTW
ncbi:MAG: hypothetical protein OQK69_11260 [Gammaproteobacteria bacterium]|nr:hypothetical protein [Gammaproteobacteria bacterium]